MGHHLGAQLARPLRDRLRLHDAFGAYAQRIQLTATHIAHHQVLQHLLEVRLLGFDQDVLRGAISLGALLQYFCRFRIDTAVSTVTVITGR